MDTLKWLLIVMIMTTLTAVAGTRKAEVNVLGVGDEVLEAKSGSLVLRLITPPKKRWLIRGLAKGDAVTVSYERDGKRFILTKIEGSGVVVGKVAKIEKVFITVESEDGVKHRLMPKWIGGMPMDGGGHDKAVLKQMHSVKVGQRVKLAWTIEEGKRVTNVTPLGEKTK